MVWGSAVYIETPGGYGSGWAIDQGLIVTNAHVVAFYSQVTLHRGSGAPIPGTVLGKDNSRDIALVSFNTSLMVLRPLPTRSLSTEDIGEPLMVLGYSSSGVKGDGTVGAPSAKQGILSQLTRLTEGWDNLRIDAVMDPGDSGGPVIDRSGRVVGMNRSAVQTTSSGARVVGVYYAVPVYEIQKVLEDLKAGKSLP